MVAIAQRRAKLSGQWYDRGAEVPDELVTDRLVGMGFVARAASSSGASDLEVEKLRRELAEARAALEEAGVDVPGPAFDPSAHKVDEVLAYVDGAPDDAERVRAAEAAGKSRATLLAALDERLAGEDEVDENAGGAGVDEGDDAPED